MRLLLTAALTTCALSAAAPQFACAQDGATAAAAPAPSAEARQALWCGAAFTILSGDADLDETTAAEYKSKASAAFGNAAAELIPEGMTVDQFEGLVARIAADVTAPFREEAYTRAQCEDAAAPAGSSGPEEAPIPAEPPAAGQ